MQRYTIFFITVNAATARGSSKQAWHIPDAVCTVFELLMMGEAILAQVFWLRKKYRRIYRDLNHIMNECAS
jgi:hypothetical protein